MEKEKPYQPTEEEMQQAGDMMTDEQQIEMSETRERLFKEAESIIRELGWHKKNEKTGDEYIGSGYNAIPVSNMSLGDIKDAYEFIAYKIKNFAEKTRTERWQLENIKSGSYPGIEGMLWTESDAKRSIDGRGRSIKPKELELARLESLNIPSRLENMIYKIEGGLEKRADLMVDGKELSVADIFKNKDNILENPSASPGVLRVMAEGENWRGLGGLQYRPREAAKIAMHPNTPADILDMLGGDGYSDEVRRMVALNPNTPIDTLLRMADEDREFLEQIEQNPSVPDEVLIELIKERRKRFNFSKVKYLESIEERGWTERRIKWDGDGIKMKRKNIIEIFKKLYKDQA